MKEIELKLSFPRKLSAKVYSELSALWGKPVSSSVLQNTYYDTPDFAMQRSTTALRLRDLGDAWEQTLKGGGKGIAGLHVRDEWNWRLPDNKLDIAKLSEIELVKGIELERVGPVFETNFERTKWMVEVGSSVFELALDIGEIRGAGGVKPISEIEIELKEGDVSCVMVVADRIAKQVPCWLSKKSKAARGYSLAGIAAAKREHDPERSISVLLDELIDDLACYMEAIADGDGTNWYKYVECIAGINSLLTLSGSKRSSVGLDVEVEIESLFHWMCRKEGSDFSKYVLNSKAPGLIGLEVLRRELTN